MNSNQEQVRIAATWIATNISSQLQNNSELTDDDRQVIISKLLARADAAPATSDESGAAYGITDAELAAFEIPDAELAAAEILSHEPGAVDDMPAVQLGKILAELTKLIAAAEPAPPVPAAPAAPAAPPVPAAPRAPPTSPAAAVDRRRSSRINMHKKRKIN